MHGVFCIDQIFVDKRKSVFILIFQKCNPHLFLEKTAEISSLEISNTCEGAGEYAEITVPSLTPSSLPANTKENTAAITAMDTSKQILVVPKFVFYVRITI